MAFLHTSSGQEGTLEGLEDRTQEQMFDLTWKLRFQNTKHPDDDLKSILYSVKKKSLYFDLDSFLHKEENDWESEIS